MKLYIKHFTTITLADYSRRIEVDLISGETYAIVLTGSSLGSFFRGLYNDDSDCMLNNKRQLCNLVLSAHNLTYDEFDFV